MKHVARSLAAIRFALSTRRDLLLEILALRHQLAVRTRSNRRVRPSDRLLWLMLRRVWPRWRDVLVLVQAATVDRWHRDRCVRRWWRRSRRPGRPRIDSRCRELIGRLAEENRLWGAPRITANCSSSDSSLQNARCRDTCENGRRDRLRPGAHSSRITSASSNSIPKCCHRMCRAMTSSTGLRACVAQGRKTLAIMPERSQEVARVRRGSRDSGVPGSSSRRAAAHGVW